MLYELCFKIGKLVIWILQIVGFLDIELINENIVYSYSLHWVIDVMCDSYVTYVICGSHVATSIYNSIKYARSLNIFLPMLKSQKIMVYSCTFYIYQS